MQTVTNNDTVYCKNAKGELVPESMVKPIDILRDQLVTTLVEKVLKMREIMASVKAEALEDIQSFLDIAAAEYGVELGGKKGNLSLATFDGDTKILIAINNKLDYTEGIGTAKALIDEYLSDLTKDSNETIKTLVMSAFRVKEGKMDIKRILELRKYNIEDERWIKAMNIISDSIIVGGTKEYFRLYKKHGDEYQAIGLDFSTL